MPTWKIRYIRESFEKSQNNLNKLNKEFVEGAQAFARDPDISNAEQVAKDIGVLDEGGGGDDCDFDGGCDGEGEGGGEDECEGS